MPPTAATTPFPEPSPTGKDDAYRSLPVNIEAEKALLGAIFVDYRAYEKVSEFLRPAHFAIPEHGRIFDACGKLIEKGQIANPVTLKGFFEADEGLAGIGGPAYLVDLAGSAVLIINAAEYGRIVYDLHLKRELIGLGEEVVNRAFAGEVDSSATDQIEQAERELYDLASTGDYEGGFRPFTDSVKSAIDMAEAAHKRDGGLAGVATGFSDLDKLLGGLHNSDLVVLAGRPAMGKAQPLDAKVRCVNGWKRMGDLKLGDKLASIDGLPSTVAGLFPQGRRQVYKVTFSDGRNTRCCGEHLWRIHYRSWNEARLLTTDQLRTMLARKRYQKRLWIDLCSGDFGHNDPLPLDPWLLGALLGDGSLRGSSVRFSTADQSIATKVAESAGPDLRLRDAGGYDVRIVQAADHRRPGRQGVWPNPVKESLQALRLWGKRSEGKFIPDIYLTANKSARLGLLCGLLDTDGWVEKWGTVRFSTASERLADDTVSLARSLGAWCSKKTKTHPAYTYRGGKRRGRTAYVLTIRHDRPKELFSVIEKRARARTLRHRKMPVLLAIEESGIADTQCIAVTHPQRTYLTDDFIPTHNTALATNIAYNAAYDRQKSTGTDDGAVVGFFSLEMSAEQLASRILSEQTEISSDRMRKGELSNDEFTKLVMASQALHQIPFYIDDTPALTVSALRTRARRLKRVHGLGLIVVDYLQLIGSVRRHDSRVQEVSEITRGLKTLAKELNVPVLALSQLSRAVEQRENKRPLLSDLRESGSIEQDADVVMFIFREEYYLERDKPVQRADEKDDPFRSRYETWERRVASARCTAEISVSKQRHGPTGDIELMFDGMYTRFGNLDRHHGN